MRLKDLRLLQQTRKRHRPTVSQNVRVEWLKYLVRYYKKEVRKCQTPPVSFEQWKRRRAFRRHVQ